MAKVPNDLSSIEARIQTLRGVQALLDFDLATLYGVTTGALIQAVKRNTNRFPADFMIRLSNQEVARLRSQSVISKRRGRGGRSYSPYAFTEQGVAMLSSVLRSPAAIAVNIEIMRAFVRLRRASVVSQKLMSVITELAQRVNAHDSAIKDLVETIRRLVGPQSSAARRPIGFVPIR